MKKSILILLLFAFANSFGQIVINSTSPESIILHNANFNRNATLTTPYDALTPYVMNVYFTLINDAAGHNPLTGQNVVDTPEQAEAKFLECIKFLNKSYNASKIFFKYDGYQIVTNGTISTPDGWFLSTPPDPSGNYAPGDITQYTKSNDLNFVFFNLSLPSNDWFSIMGLNVSLCSTSILNSPLLEKSIVHKMGHTLSLYHTYQTGSHFQPGDPLYNFTLCEHIARNGSTFNADIAGDEVIDTPAQPIVHDFNFTNSCGTYIPLSAGSNCEQLPYVDIFNGNFMGSPEVTSVCELRFSAGQTKRMREFILNSPTTLYSPDLPDYYGVIENTRNTVASLYKPYSMAQIVSPEILSSTDNGDGTAKVCRSYNVGEFKFQPGFTYTFLAEPDITAEIVSTATVNDYPVIVHQPVFNCPIVIGELASSLTNLTDYIGQVETVCRGEICVNEPFISGTDTRTLILGSMNITVEQLNAIQVKDPELYNKLMEEYYHILEKYTASGAKTKEVIYKN